MSIWSIFFSGLSEAAFGNQAAVAALIAGSASSPLGGLPLSIFWRAAIRLYALWRIEYVNTNANAAGAPARDCSGGALSFYRSVGPRPTGPDTVGAPWASLRNAPLGIAGFN